MKINISLLLFFLLLHSNVCAQEYKIKGKIIDNETNIALVGATVLLKGTLIGGITDFDGEFEIIIKREPPFTIICSFISFYPQEFVLNSSNENLLIKLEPETFIMDGIVVRETRLTEKQKESPLTIESMDILAIKETPAINFYDGLGLLKGVDITAASIGFKIINTRGFNSTRPVRSLQIIDGVDNQAPGLNFSLGNFLGASELDLQKVEIIAGASTAMFGPNAFNGVIKMTTKSPYVHQGLTFSTKIGERNLVETMFRYAKVFKNKVDEDKLAFKINMYLFKANDWEADNLDATEQSMRGKDNWGGYDAVNIYGDENITAGTNNYSSSYGRRNYPGLGIFYRTGYLEKDLVDYNSKNMKLSGSLHYKITDDIEAQYSYFFGTGTTVYQGDNRYSLKGIKFQQHKFEISNPGVFFIRAYTTHEDAGESYDAVFTALLLQEAAKSNSAWGTDYAYYYDKYITNKVRDLPGFPDLMDYFTKPDSTYAAVDQLMQEYSDSMYLWHQQARNYADGVGILTSNLPFFEPGTLEFDSAFNSIISKSTFMEGGSGFKDKSALSHLQGQYNIYTEYINILLGSSYRKYLPNSAGTIFSDTGNVVITNYEYALYSRLERRFFNRRLILTATGRLDKNENFDYLISPAASVVFMYNEKNYYRLSFSSAIRNPTLQDQYLYYNVGRAVLIGNINGFDSLVTVPSLIDYYVAINRDTLSYFNVRPVRPEKVKTIEIGYKGTVFNNKLFIDASYYFSIYKDFLGFKLGADLEFDTNSGWVNHTQFYRVSANSDEMVTTQGFSVGLSYNFYKNYSFTGNYSFNKLDRRDTDDPIIPAFNTPRNKFNIGFSARNISSHLKILQFMNSEFPLINIRHFGFNINYKWIEGFLFEGSPQFTGNIPSYDILDAQINIRIPKIKTTFKLGATNILNKKRFHTYGGPYIGRLAYFNILIELDNLH